VTGAEIRPVQCECILIQGVEIVFLRKEVYGVGGLKKTVWRVVDYEGR
jgi:hypothetical protein